MMPREVLEWLGKNDDSDPPPRVKVRVFDRYHGVCRCGCTRKILAGEQWQADHIIALINGGENRESNLHPLLVEHHKSKTKEDVAAKSEVYNKRKSHLGLKKKSRFACSKDSKFKKKMDGTVVRR
jgi:5-methylcytosine-specific restriction enzyme A